MIIPSFHTEQLKEGEGDIIWTIYLKNGDTLRLHHTVKIMRIPVVTLTENDYPMATIDDLNALLDTLAHEADRKSVYILQLPAVTYEGGLTMKNFCCDLIGSESGTTFTGTVTIATRGIHPSNITNVRFVGDGTGIGLSASEGAFLHRCTFENWEIGAYGGLGSWVNATGCTFRGNGVGLWLDNRGDAMCSGSYYGDSVYEDNGTAVRIAAMPGTETLDFNNCVFRGNGVNVENAAGELKKKGGNAAFPPFLCSFRYSAQSALYGSPEALPFSFFRARATIRCAQRRESPRAAGGRTGCQTRLRRAAAPQRRDRT